MRKMHLQITKLRKAKGVTQQEVADAVGVSYQTVSKWEAYDGVTVNNFEELLALLSSGISCNH